jgi:hypothetical protein
VSAAAGKAAAATPFVKDSLFSHVRHPLHAALIVALFSSPIMTGIFAVHWWCVPCPWYDQGKPPIQAHLSDVGLVGRLLFAVGVSLFLIIHSILKDQEMIS